MTIAAIERLRTERRGLSAQSEKMIATLSHSLNLETLHRLDALFSSDSVAPVIRRIGRRRIMTRTRPKDILAWSIGQHIAAARERRHWRQEDLARECGLARANIARLEAGRHMPKLSTLERVARALGVRTDLFLRAPATAKDRETKMLAESGAEEWGNRLDAEDAAQ